MNNQPTGKLIRAHLAQKKGREFFKQFFNVEFKSFIELGHEHPVQQKIFAFNEPASSIEVNADDGKVRAWFQKNCDPFVADRKRPFLVSASCFSHAGWAEISLQNTETLWQMWEKSERTSFYLADQETGEVLKFMQREYEHVFFSGK
jgi:hypothetical protein